MFDFFLLQTSSPIQLFIYQNRKKYHVKLFVHSWASMTSQPRRLSTFPQLFPFLKQRNAHGEQVASSEQSADGLYTLLWALRPKARETHKGAPMDQTPARGSMACQEFLIPVLKEGEAVHKYFTVFLTSEKHFTFRQSQVEFFIPSMSPWMSSGTLEKILTQTFHSALLFSQFSELLCPPTYVFLLNYFRIINSLSHCFKICCIPCSPCIRKSKCWLALMKFLNTHNYFFSS